MTVWDGVYTAAQASRGAAKFETQCVTCHGPDGSDGNAPSVKGERFERRWSGGDVKTLFNTVRTTMPRSAAGRARRPRPHKRQLPAACGRHAATAR